MNANDELQDHNSTDNYYRFSCGLVITDGTKTLAERFQCYWFLDIVASYQGQLKGYDFQVWKLVKHGISKATITCTDGNGKVLKVQWVEWTDFSADEATVWVELDCILLPSEH